MHYIMNQDISLFCEGQKVSRSPRLQDLAEIKAADLVPFTLDRRLCILGRYVGAVLTDSFLPAVPIQSIETDDRADADTSAVPRGARSFHLVAVDQGFLSAPPKLAKLLRPPQIPRRDTRREKESRGVPDFQKWRPS